MKRRLVVAFDIDVSGEKEDTTITNLEMILTNADFNRGIVKGWHVLGIAYPAHRVRMSAGPNDPWVDTIQYRKADS